MAIDSVPALTQSFEAKIISDFIERLRVFVNPYTNKFDLQMQLALAMQEERQNMTNWREAHGLPNWHPARADLATTPPMPLPFIEHHSSSLDNSFATSFGDSESNFNGNTGWTSGSSSSSPFRQTMNHSVTDGTISPHELLSHGSLAMIHPTPYTEDMGMFTFSDSDHSLPSLPQPPIPSNNRRKTGQRSGASTRYSQNPAHQQGRRPLPAGPGQSASRGRFEGFGTHEISSRNGSGQQSYTTGGQHQQSHQELMLRSNEPGSTQGYTTLRPSRRQVATQVQAHASKGPKLAPAAVTTATATTTTTMPVSAFPPGQNMPGFVPIGRVGIASAAQGNRWPIERNLMEQLVGAERGHGEHRRKTRLTYKEILAKYSRWDIKESTLRGIKRKITLPKEHRERKPRWDAEHISSLRLHVPMYTDKKGKVAWTKVVDAIKRDTGRPFGAGTTSKKWSDINKIKTKRGAVPDQQSESGGEEIDVDENESSSSVFDMVDVSEEDLPSHKFSFQVEEDEDDSLGSVGSFVPVNAPASGLQCQRMWH